MTYIPEGTFGGSSAGGQLVFAWNKTDISQFVGSSPDYTDGTATGWAASFVTITDRGPAIRFVSNGNGATETAIWLLDDAIPFVDDNRNAIIEMEVHDGSYGAGGYAGLAIGCDLTGGLHALNHFVFGAAERATRIDAGGTPTTTGATSGAEDGGYARFEMRGQRRASDSPLISTHVHHSGSTFVTRRTGDTTASGPNSAGGRPYGNGSALVASWNGLQADRWGVVLGSSGGNVAPSQVDVLDLKVYLLA